MVYNLGQINRVLKILTRHLTCGIYFLGFFDPLVFVIFKLSDFNKLGRIK